MKAWSAACSGLASLDRPLQFHWWTFEHPGYLDAMKELARSRTRALSAISASRIRHGPFARAGEARHSHRDEPGLAFRSSIAARRRMRVLPREWRSPSRLWHAGRRPPERSLARPSGAGRGEISDWSKMKYSASSTPSAAGRRFSRFSRARRGRRRHGVSIANVATRWVLDQPAVAASSSARGLASASTAPTISALRVRPRRAGPRGPRRSTGRGHAAARRLRGRIPQASLPHGVRRSQPPSRALPSLRGHAHRRAAGPAAHR